MPVPSRHDFREDLKQGSPGCSVGVTEAKAAGHTGCSGLLPEQPPERFPYKEDVGGSIPFSSTPNPWETGGSVMPGVVPVGLLVEVR